MTDQRDTLISQTQLAARLGVSERTVQRLVRRGVLPSVRVGNTPVFHWPTVEQALLDRADRTAVDPSSAAKVYLHVEGSRLTLPAP